MITPLLICKYKPPPPLTRSQCRVFDIQVTVRPVGLLFHNIYMWSIVKLQYRIIVLQNNCVLGITTAISGNYAVAIQIEDFKDTSSTTPLSSVPLQFVINVQSIPCTSFPAIVSPTPPAGLTLQTAKNGSLQIFARAYSYYTYVGTNIVSNDIISGEGRLKH